MSRYTLSPAAQIDVSSIWDYTKQKWGDKQAITYIQDIRDACHDLAAGTRIGRTSNIRKGYRKYLVGSHMIYFKFIGKNTITIVRILHQKMDVNRHL